MSLQTARERLRQRILEKEKAIRQSGYQMSTCKRAFCRKLFVASRTFEQAGVQYDKERVQQILKDLSARSVENNGNHGTAKKD